jgi:hypothetical protein
MARYRIMYWKEFPAQVKAQDEQSTASALLDERFQQYIDAAAMAENSVGADAYLDGWGWGPEQERPGGAQEVLEAVKSELETAYSAERLAEMVRSRRPA